MNQLYPTPHINAKPQDFGKTVLMPGDPLRSKFIAENFLENARLINNVRGVQGYTGLYQGAPITVMASGMGMPSMAIYSHELFQVFGVENIIRIGTCGGIGDHVKVRDIVLAQGCCTDSAYGENFRTPGTFAPIGDFGLLSACVSVARRQSLTYHVGNVVTSDRFYHDNDGLKEAEQPIRLWKKMGVLATEMEAAALYMNAARAGKRALAICTVSDHMITGESLDAAARETSFTHMMTLALETAKAVD